jgi:hypothetical protein
MFVDGPKIKVLNRLPADVEGVVMTDMGHADFDKSTTRSLDANRDPFWTIAMLEYDHYAS